MKKLSFILFFMILIFSSFIAFAAEDNLPIERRINTLQWVSYAPTNFNPEIGLFPSDDSIRQDMRVLRAAGFNGIITYASDGTLYRIPKIAKEEGFKSVIMGVWNVNSNVELQNAKNQAIYVSAYSIGNEGLYGRYTLSDLNNAYDFLSVTGKPITTTEERNDYLIDANVLNFGDFLLPNIHPYWDGVVSAGDGANHVKDEYMKIKALTNKSILIKETGYPTSGDFRVSETLQKSFYAKLATKKKVKFSYFEAFDQPWKDNLAVEPHWGLFKSDRTPKKVVSLFN